MSFTVGVIDGHFLLREKIAKDLRVTLAKTGETAQWLRALDALAEDLSSVPNIHKDVQNYLQLQFRCINIYVSLHKHT